VIGWEDWAFAPVKWLSPKVVFEMTYCELSGPLISTVVYYLLWRVHGYLHRGMLVFVVLQYR